MYARFENFVFLEVCLQRWLPRHEALHGGTGGDGKGLSCTLLTVAEVSPADPKSGKPCPESRPNLRLAWGKQSYEIESGVLEVDEVVAAAF